MASTMLGSAEAALITTTVTMYLLMRMRNHHLLNLSPL
jgi:hypothetical protein